MPARDSLRTLMRTVMRFRDERDWKQFHGFKDLAITLALEDRQQVMLAQTEDFREATRAFAEKRAPVYRDR